MDFEITPQNCLKLEEIFRHKFLDLAKVIELFDPNLVTKFKAINKAHMKHDCDESKGGCCHSVTNRFYMPRDAMSSIDRILDDILF